MTSVPLHQQITEYFKIHQLVPQMTGVNIQFIVIELGQLFRTISGDTIQTLKVADTTGSVTLSLRSPDLIEAFQPGDIIKLKNGYTNVHRGSLTLSCGRNGECLRIGEFFMGYTETPNMSEYNAQYAANERARKGSPPEEGEVSSGDPRRNSVNRGGFPGSKRPQGFNSNSGGAGPPPKRPDISHPNRGRP
ncbi:unnamed protein product [Auanema sp. JU1783]|nr:unnamed protein product [Auanema sp. JU1783]